MVVCIDKVSIFFYFKRKGVFYVSVVEEDECDY